MQSINGGKLLKKEKRTMQRIDINYSLLLVDINVL